MKTPLVPLAMALLLLSGCGSGASSQTATSTAPGATQTSATPTPGHTATTAVDPRERRIHDLYLDSIRDEQPALMDVPYEDLVTMGQGFCDMYDGGAVGADVNDFILMAGGVGFTVQELEAVHGAAVGALCPEHTDKVGEQGGWLPENLSPRPTFP